MGDLIRTLFDARDALLDRQIHEPKCDMFESRLAAIFPNASRQLGCNLHDTPTDSCVARWEKPQPSLTGAITVPGSPQVGEALLEASPQIKTSSKRARSTSTEQREEHDLPSVLLKASKTHHALTSGQIASEQDVAHANAYDSRTAPAPVECHSLFKTNEPLFATNGGLTCFASAPKVTEQVTKPKVPASAEVGSEPILLSLATQSDFPLIDDPNVLIQVFVGGLGQPLLCVKAPQTATVGQICVAFAELTNIVPHCRPQDIVGQFVSVSRPPQDQMILLLQDPADYQTEKCPLEGCAPFLPNASTRESLLLQQEAWVARDEMDYYLESLHEYVDLPTVPTWFIRDDPFSPETFAQWLTRSTAQAQKFCTAVLFRCHWSPLKVEVTSEGVCVSTTHWFAEQIAQWQKQISALPTIEIRAFHLPNTFAADCGFQTIGYIWSEVSQSTYVPMHASSASFWRTNFLIHIRKHAVCISGRSWQWGGMHSHDDVKHQLTKVLGEHGVFADRLPDRVALIFEKLTPAKVAEALQGSRQWTDLKQLANRVGLKLIQGDELDAQIQARQKNGYSGRNEKKGHKQRNGKPTSEKEAFVRVPCLSPSDILLPTGLFKEVPNISLRQVQITQIGPTLNGVIVVDCQEATMLLRQPQPISSKGLALLIIDDHTGHFEGQGEILRFPATFVKTSEPIIISARLVQIGNVLVTRHLPDQLLSVDQVKTATIRLLVYRDEFAKRLGTTPAKPSKVHSWPI